MSPTAAELAAWTRSLAEHLPPDEARAKAARWGEVRHLFAGCSFTAAPQGRVAEKGWDLRFLLPDEVAPQAEAALRSLGAKVGKPYAKRGRTVVPVYGLGSAWLLPLVDPEHPQPRRLPPPAAPPPRAAATTLPDPTEPPEPEERLELRFLARVAETDTGFERSTFRGVPVWAGPCHGCGERVVVSVEPRRIDGCHARAVNLGRSGGPGGSAILCVRCLSGFERRKARPEGAEERARLADLRAARRRITPEP